MVKDLPTDLGNQYIREFLVGACFRIGDIGYWLRAVEGNRMTLDSVDLNGSGEFERVELPTSMLKSFETFKYPTLGYRQKIVDGVGPIVSHISTTRSAQRGLRWELLKQQFLPVFHNMGMAFTDQAYLGAGPTSMRTLFNPKFTNFATGIKQLLAGDIGGFAVNEYVAVGVSCTRGADRSYDIYFRDRVVGHVTTGGNVVITNKVVSRNTDVNKVLR